MAAGWGFCESSWGRGEEFRHYPCKGSILVCLSLLYPQHRDENPASNRHWVVWMEDMFPYLMHLALWKVFVWEG